MWIIKKSNALPPSSIVVAPSFELLMHAAAITVRPSLHEAVLCAKVFSFKILVTRTLQAEPKITTTR